MSQQREDVGGELVDVALLVVAREVEDQLGEAEVDVRLDLVRDLLRVGGDDEAGVRAVERVVGQALHLHRVLDALLLLGRERQRRPPVRRLLARPRGRGRRRP